MYFANICDTSKVFLVFAAAGFEFADVKTDLFNTKVYRSCINCFCHLRAVETSWKNYTGISLYKVDFESCLWPH